MEKKKKLRIYIWSDLGNKVLVILYIVTGARYKVEWVVVVYKFFERVGCIVKRPIK